MREVFEYAAYHWSIMIMPKTEASQGQDRYVFDATDASSIDPDTFRLTNPTMDWWFRHRNDDAAPALIPKLLGRIVIGRVPDGMSYDDFVAFFRQIPLPIRNQEPQQNCVTWAVSAVRALQQQGWVQEFDLDQFKDWALSYGDARMKGEDSELTQYGAEA
jgi:hypothetical protein